MDRKPGILALRAINQYRQRDVFSYLALRYYLDNAASRTDQWAQKFCVESVLRRSSQPYSSVLHFKEMTDGQPSHRQMYFPSASEALAEAALIDACSRSSGDGFRLNDAVYSYNPVSTSETSGIFNHYMEGFRRRHEAITSACQDPSGKVVSFMDIKRFYPSIGAEVAEKAWSRACEASDISSTFRSLGDKLIRDHGARVAHDSASRVGILTGPMFSHFLANLLLTEVDRRLSNADVSYCRYVDDITLVGAPEKVRVARAEIVAMLSDLGLELHDDAAGKSMEIAASTWLNGAQDDDEWQQADSWMRLVGDIKRLLVTRPESSSEVGVQFMAHGFRMPVLDYSSAAQETGYLRRFSLRGRPLLEAGRSTSVIIRSLVDRARELKERYAAELDRFSEHYAGSDGFEAKRLVPKIRYRLGRLAYLSDQRELKSMGEDITDPTLALHSEVVKAIGTGKVDRILEMGRNVAQAVAQPIGMASNRVVVTKHVLTEGEVQALAVFMVNGVEVELPSVDVLSENELIRFVEAGPDLEMMRSDDPFIAQLASLHGLSSTVRHFNVLDTPFDPLEEIALDALDPAGGSL